eukprot:scaffold20555_cov57-Attheya_sp.AAC.3
MDDANATDGIPAAMEAIGTLALAASEAPEAPVIDIVCEDRATELSIQAGFEQTKAEMRVLELRVIQAELRMSRDIDSISVKSSLKDNKEKSCNKRIYNVETGKREKCGIKPVVMIYEKQQYCLEHRDLRWNEINAKCQAHKMAKEKKSTSNAHPSMSVICALSDDGFYLDIFPGSHKPSYFDEKHESSDPIHFSDSARVHVPQTYAILFHKWFYYCGSAVPSNPLDAHCQLRLFAYVWSMTFSHDSVLHDSVSHTQQPTTEPKQLRSKIHTSNLPDATYTHAKASVMCRDENEVVWLCKKCDGDKVKKREQANNNIVKPKSDTIKPGTIVAGSLEIFGYIIFRTSISHEECEYLQTIEGNLSGQWDNIGHKGKQKVPPRTQRQQYSVQMANKTAKPLLDIPFLKLRNDILKVDPPLSNMGQCDKKLEHQKLLRNIGPCAKQYPHSDYTFTSITMSDKNYNAINKKGGKKKKARIKKRNLK